MVDEEKKSLTTSLLRCALTPASQIFALFVALRGWGYSSGLRKISRLDLPVVSIGNLAVGGTGKTPFTICLARDLASLRVAILSRGYRCDLEREAAPRLVGRGGATLFPPSYMGDEPTLMTHHLPAALSIVGPDRVAGGRLAIQEGAQLILLDDGMQHRRLYRDIEVVLINRGDVQGGRALPRGSLREPLTALRRADYLVSADMGGESDAIQKSLSRYTSAGLIGTALQPTQVKGQLALSLDELKGKKVALFCGIASPQRFVSQAVSLGAHPVVKLVLPDHKLAPLHPNHPFIKEAVARGAELLLCTEKDWVKYDSKIDLGLPLAYLEVEMAVTSGKSAYSELLARCFALSN